MRSAVIILGIAAVPPSLAGCNSVECGEGTIERDGVCQPATVETSGATCGPFTELQVDRCVPQFPPTVCDPTTSIATTDPETGVTTCVGTGGGGCSATFPCPTPTGSSKLTMCGQLYDLETGLKFQGVDPAGTACDPAAPAASGPCALSITPYDAVELATDPTTAQPRSTDEIYIDDCGRYRLTNIDASGLAPFIGLAIDDAAGRGPGGVTVTTGVAARKADVRVENHEAYIVKLSTEQKWETSGGPPLSGGIYVASYRAHALAAGVDRHAPQAGVTFANVDGTTYASDDYYFTAAQTTHETIDGAAGATGMNGSALVTGRSVAEGIVFGGQGGITSAGCRWEPHAAATIPGVVFVQLFRKIDAMGMPGACTE